ncbi:hypothetical protein F2Q69_00008128 [Brassica cretica]|uniref:Uncharacterized protein n=1 Tax=Brassica cretica TaxID=69181 RepID=A0A8S9NVC0_BRACR|nr:hypothetical protein F2Q69_00008128 [Brassica cretica]
MIDLLEDKTVKTDVSCSLVISQWAKLGLEELDFGGGKPMYTGSLTSDIYCLFLPVAGNLDAIKVQVSLPEDVVQRLEYYMLRVIIKSDKESPSAVKANVLTRAAPAAGGSHHRWERSGLGDLTRGCFRLRPSMLSWSFMSVDRANFCAGAVNGSVGFWRFHYRVFLDLFESLQVWSCIGLEIDQLEQKGQNIMQSGDFHAEQSE